MDGKRAPTSKGKSTQTVTLKLPAHSQSTSDNTLQRHSEATTNSVERVSYIYVERVPSPAVRSAEDASLSRCRGMARSPSPALVPPSFFKDVIIFFRKPSSGSMLSPAKRDKERQRFCFFLFDASFGCSLENLHGRLPKVSRDRTDVFVEVSCVRWKRTWRAVVMPASISSWLVCLHGYAFSGECVGEGSAPLAFEGRRRDEVTLPACHVGWREATPYAHTHTKKKFYEFPFFWRT